MLWFTSQILPKISKIIHGKVGGMGALQRTRLSHEAYEVPASSETTRAAFYMQFLGLLGAQEISDSIIHF